MKTKEEIVANWLPRYTKRNLEDFGEYILLTNFNKYVEIFANQFDVPILGRDANMISATAEGITMINFGMGSPNAAIIMDLLGAIRPKACLFLGKCGGIDKKNQIGDLILPIAAIRGEGTSNDYFPPEVPALPAFMLQRAASHIERSCFIRVFARRRNPRRGAFRLHRRRRRRYCNGLWQGIERRFEESLPKGAAHTPVKVHSFIQKEQKASQSQTVICEAFFAI